MSELTSVFLPIHILTAIFAFGPTFAFPLIAGMAAAQPQHGLFALQLTDRIERRITLPAAITMPISGFLLVWSEGIDLFAARWLLVSIVLFAIAIVFALSVQVSTLERMIRIMEGIAAGSAESTQAAQPRTAPVPALSAGPGAALARSAEAADRRSELARLGRRAQLGGIGLALFVIVVVTLMAAKPF